jgi:16S rRNA (adenine1518-N6/adenine1519-N6)-dimethyltransferase
MKIIKKKSLGQNFLKDEEVLDEIILAGELSDSDNVLEIGPGEGALTKKLLEKVSKVVAIEKDERMKDQNSALQKICRKSGLLQNEINLYFGDILDVNLPELLQKNDFQNYKVIANIPYYITGKIVRLLFQQEQLPELIVLLVQKEVADRICAKKERQSILSLSVQYYAEAEVIDYVSREAFEPAPKVDSAILKIVPFKSRKKANKAGLIKSGDSGVLSPSFSERAKEDQFFQLVKVGFSSPRKVLLNNLKNGLKMGKEELTEIFNKLNLDLNIRAEKLTIAEWKKIDNLLNR